MIPGLKIHQLLIDPVWQNKLFKLIDVFLMKSRLLKEKD